MKLPPSFRGLILIDVIIVSLGHRVQFFVH
jgi:hypothetical protein